MLLHFFNIERQYMCTCDLSLVFRNAWTASVSFFLLFFLFMKNMWAYDRFECSQFVTIIEEYYIATELIHCGENSTDNRKDNSRKKRWYVHTWFDVFSLVWYLKTVFAVLFFLVFFRPIHKTAAAAATTTPIWLYQKE